ncbi:MAG: lysophospholipid acyltransferase family protein [Mariprofundaceae bacterium]
MKNRLLHWLLPRLIKAVILFVFASIRWQTVDEHDFAGDERGIYAFWHNRLLLAVLWLKIRPAYALISDHRDGSFVADTMALFNVGSIRGSSTRGGARALLQMVRKFKQEQCALVISPDGPKGSREKVQMGTVILAKKTGLPVRPFCWATKRQWRVTSSWDHFYIPKPFTRGVYILGEPVMVAEEEDDAVALARVQAAMDATKQQADGYFDA